MGRQQRRAAERRAARQGRKVKQGGGLSMGPLLAIGGVILVAILFVGFAVAQNANNNPTPTATVAASAPAVDGIQCGAMEQLAYHIHQYLELYDHGKQVTVPSEIGIPGTEAATVCFYWIHVHQLTPNLIHVESPTPKIYTLGNFFDIWEATKTDAQPPGDAFLRKLRAAAARGQVTAFYNGKPWRGSYRSIPLRSHAVITVEIGKPIVKPKLNVNWYGNAG